MKKLILIQLCLLLTSIGRAQTVSDLIVVEINRFRAEEGLEPIKRGSCFDQAAQYHANWMAEARAGGHTEDRRVGPTVPLAQPRDRFARYGCNGFGENVLRWYPSGESAAVTARAVVQAWKDSPDHRELMLVPQVDDQLRLGIGIAAWADGSGASYCLTFGLK